MNGHLFGQSGRPGIDRCRCGTERWLLDDTGFPYWFFRWPKGMASTSSPPCPKATA